MNKIYKQLTKNIDCSLGARLQKFPKCKALGTTLTLILNLAMGANSLVYSTVKLSYATPINQSTTVVLALGTHEAVGELMKQNALLSALDSFTINAQPARTDTSLV